MIHIVILGEPVAKERARRGRAGNWYTPTKTREAEELLGWEYKRALAGRPMDGESEFKIEATFYRSTRRRFDGDNAGKWVCDSGNGIIWADDMQVTDMHFKVVKGDPNPRTEIIITRIDK